MHRSKFFFIIAALFTLQTSCIKRYEPVINKTDVSKFVISGEVLKGDQIQTINITQSVSVNEPRDKSYVPVTGCYVVIADDRGNVYNASEVGNGNYEVGIPESNFKTGVLFKLEILTPGGDNIVSDYDQFLDCPDVDSVYYKVEQPPVLDPNSAKKGVRFYCNLDATNFSCRNFRWEAIETWEYKAVFATSATNKKVCWMTGLIRNVFTLSTKTLSENKYSDFPFHVVDNYSSQRLVWGYSLLIRQYSLSETAFEYWEKIRSNSSQDGGLYTKQPLQIKGNMHNLTHPEQTVLGFFGASEVKSKRIYVEKVKGITNEYLDCDPPVALGPKPDPTCYNCLLEGGTNIKPSFWPY
jgi:hypothetical protein